MKYTPQSKHATRLRRMEKEIHSLVAAMIAAYEEGKWERMKEYMEQAKNARSDMRSFELTILGYIENGVQSY